MLQQDQITELSHYLNITYGHVSSNRYAISNLQVRLAEINKTLIATLSDIKFVKYTVAISSDISAMCTYTHDEVTTTTQTSMM